MSQVGKNAAMGGGEQQGISPVIQGSDTGGPAVRIGVLGAVGCYDEGSGGHLCGIPPSDHGEAGEAAGRQGVGDTSG